MQMKPVSIFTFANTSAKKHKKKDSRAAFPREDTNGVRDPPPDKKLLSAFRGGGGGEVE